MIAAADLGGGAVNTSVRRDDFRRQHEITLLQRTFDGEQGDHEDRLDRPRVVRKREDQHRHARHAWEI